MASAAASSCRSPSQPATDASLTEGPTPEQKAAAREVDRRMNYEEINEDLEDRLGGVLEGPTPEQKAAAREEDRRMNYEEINESPEDRLGETTPVQIFYPLIRIDSEEEEEDEKRSCFTVSSSTSEQEGGAVYRLQFPSGVYLREYPLLRLPGVTLGERLFLFRNRNGPGH